MLSTLVTAAATLGGVVVGALLQTRAQRIEREATQRADLVKDAALVLGNSRVVLTSMRPCQYAAFATTPGYDIPAEIASRRAEADVWRPQLAALAVRWPDSALELRSIERYMGLQPNRLHNLVNDVSTNAHGWTTRLTEHKQEHEDLEEALDRVERRLHNRPEPTSPPDTDTTDGSEPSDE